MTLRRIAAALLVGAVLLPLAACDTSTGVGADIGEDLEGGAPQAIDLVADSTTFGGVDIAAPVTGNTNPQRDWRVLVGRVLDPVAGEATADAYLDLAPARPIPDLVQAAPVDVLEAELILAPQYLHGDSTATVTVRLFDLQSNPDFEDARADQTFATALEVASYEVSAAEDSVVTLPLPDGWVRDNEGILRDTTGDASTFDEAFAGFKVQVSRSSAPTPSQPGAVVGFSTEDSRLELSRTDDTTSVATYPISQSFTHVSGQAPPAETEARRANRVLLRGGAPRALRFAFNFEEEARVDSLIGAPLNRVRLDVPFDTLAQRGTEAPEGFVRPRVDGYRLLMRRTDDPSIPDCESRQLGQLLTQTPESGLDPGDEEGRYCFLPTDLSELPERLSTPVLNNVVRESLQPEQPVVFESFRLEVTDRFSPAAEFSPAVPGVPTTAPVLIPIPGSPSDAQTELSIVATPI